MTHCYEIEAFGRKVTRNSTQVFTHAVLWMVEGCENVFVSFHHSCDAAEKKLSLVAKGVRTVRSVLHRITGRNCRNGFAYAAAVHGMTEAQYQEHLANCTGYEHVPMKNAK